MTERRPMSSTRKLRIFDRFCSVDDCDAIVVARGWCDRHYRRWKAHGSPEALVKTPEGEPRHFYKTLVLLFDGNGCLFWPYNRNSGGYGMLYDPDTRLHVFVHRMACAHRNGPPPTAAHQAAHSCGKGDRGCVNPRHVSWKTAKENHADKISHGTHNRGEANYAAKLTVADVRAIRRLRGIVSQTVIGRTFGVNQSTVKDIQKRRGWAWLND